MSDEQSDEDRESRRSSQTFSSPQRPSITSGTDAKTDWRTLDRDLPTTSPDEETCSDSLCCHHLGQDGGCSTKCPSVGTNKTLPDRCTCRHPQRGVRSAIDAPDAEESKVSVVKDPWKKEPKPSPRTSISEVRISRRRMSSQRLSFRRTSEIFGVQSRDPRVRSQRSLPLFRRSEEQDAQREESSEAADDGYLSAEQKYVRPTRVAIASKSEVLTPTSSLFVRELETQSARRLSRRTSRSISAFGENAEPLDIFQMMRRTQSVTTGSDADRYFDTLDEQRLIQPRQSINLEKLLRRWKPGRPQKPPTKRMSEEMLTMFEVPLLEDLELPKLQIPLRMDIRPVACPLIECIGLETEMSEPIVEKPPSRTIKINVHYHLNILSSVAVCCQTFTQWASLIVNVELIIKEGSHTDISIETDVQSGRCLQHRPLPTYSLCPISFVTAPQHPAITWFPNSCESAINSTAQSTSFLPSYFEVRRVKSTPITANYSPLRIFTPITRTFTMDFYPTSSPHSPMVLNYSHLTKPLFSVLSSYSGDVYPSPKVHSHWTEDGSVADNTVQPINPWFILPNRNQMAVFCLNGFLRRNKSSKTVRTSLEHPVVGNPPVHMGVMTEMSIPPGTWFPFDYRINEHSVVSIQQLDSPANSGEPIHDLPSSSLHSTRDNGGDSMRPPMTGALDDCATQTDPLPRRGRTSTRSEPPRRTTSNGMYPASVRGLCTATSCPAQKRSDLDSVQCGACCRHRKPTRCCGHSRSLSYCPASSASGPINLYLVGQPIPVAPSFPRSCLGSTLQVQKVCCPGQRAVKAPVAQLVCTNNPKHTRKLILYPGPCLQTGRNRCCPNWSLEFHPDKKHHRP